MAAGQPFLLLSSGASHHPESALLSPHLCPLQRKVCGGHWLLQCVSLTAALYRVSEAVQLVDMYHTQHCVSAPAGIEGLKASFAASLEYVLLLEILTGLPQDSECG